ncbi:hypothetical protein O4G76_14770 [Limimaricola sp. G21655-S1]|uniref:hypothetical protein n=1 Tax=Limimaricola sp. G21655-S1 TaxID=3014768 RepID=UPI0022AF9B79|nr:hypothetical protein [Limimaricola sp. G21655-S1]MCZ4262107.1 hypothetical protein [Limimaricola sp. G21655-S1]
MWMGLRDNVGPTIAALSKPLILVVTAHVGLRAALLMRKWAGARRAPRLPAARPCAARLQKPELLLLLQGAT